ncbi:MAG: AarF/UbiB family protein [Planctomycetota bacterium]
MSLIKPPKLGSYRDILYLLWKYGRRDILADAGIDKPDQLDDPGSPEEFAKDLERLGPTYIKLGQMLSGQLSVLSKPYTDAIARLQDDVKPIAFETIERTIEEGLGKPVTELFGSFDREPLAAASLGQVHRATLPDGTPVAVKVQRPGVEEQIAGDFDAIEPIAKLLDRFFDERYGFVEMLEQARAMVRQETDYRLEAANLTRVRSIVSGEPRLVVPKAYSGLVSKRVLVMDFVSGKKVTDVPGEEIATLDGAGLAELVFKAYLDMILVHGVYHADPHPGNVLLTENGELALIDMGMVGRVPPRLRDRLMQLILAVVQGRGDHAAEVAIKIGMPARDFDQRRFVLRVSDLVMAQKDRSIEDLRFGDVIVKIAQVCGEERLRVPPQLTAIGKAMVQLDDVGLCLDPGFEPKQAIDDHTPRLMTATLWRTLTLRGGFDYALEFKELLERLPGRLNTLTDNLARADRGFRIDAIDEDRLISGFEKIANRITVGLVVAAMFVAGALTMRVDVAGSIGGYPMISLLLFALAVAGALMLLMSIFFNRDG